MKWKLSLILAAAVISAAAVTVSAEDIKVSFDGETMDFTVQPKIINDRVMLPVRAVFEKLGAKVSWDTETQTATAVKDARYVQLTKDYEYMYFGVCRGGTDDGGLSYTTSEELDSKPVIVDGVMLVPVRAVAEAFYYNVEWDAETSTVEITTPGEADGWIYYASWNDEGHMYKIDTNGQHRQKIADGDCFSNDWQFAYINGYIYYSKRDAENPQNEGILYRIKTDGTDEKQITDKPAYLISDYSSLEDGKYDEIYFLERDEAENGNEYKPANFYYYSSSNLGGYLKKINPETGETAQLCDKLIKNVRIYKDYIYFKYADGAIDTEYTYYRMDDDGENIINITGDIPVDYLSFDAENDKLKFNRYSSSERYIADLDGSNWEKIVDSDYYGYSYDSKIGEKFGFLSLRSYMLDDEKIFIGITEDNYWCGINSNEEEIFKIQLPEGVDDVYNINIAGNRVYYNLRNGSYDNKFYVDSIDELLGMRYISVGEEMVDGKYEITDGISRRYIPSDEDGAYSIGFNETESKKLFDSDYSLFSINSDNKLMLYKQSNDDNERNYVKYYTANLDGSDLEEYYREEDNYSSEIHLYEEAHYGIKVLNDGTVQPYYY